MRISGVQLEPDPRRRDLAPLRLEIHAHALRECEVCRGRSEKRGPEQRGIRTRTLRGEGRSIQRDSIESRFRACADIER